MPLVAILGTLLIGLTLWGIVSPRSLYWTLTAWRYRDPEANEPSGAAYALTRVGSVISLGVVIAAGAGLVGELNRSAAVDERDLHCRDELLPVIERAWKSDERDARIRAFAERFDLELEVSTTPIPPWMHYGSPTDEADHLNTTAPTPTPTDTPAPELVYTQYVLLDGADILFSLDSYPPEFAYAEQPPRCLSYP